MHLMSFSQAVLSAGLLINFEGNTGRFVFMEPSLLWVECTFVCIHVGMNVSAVLEACHPN